VITGIIVVIIPVVAVCADERGCVVSVNPFEDLEASYFVLINEEGQHSLWPVFADVPDGWTVAFGEDGRQECLYFIERNWTDMRPNSLIRQMEADAAAGQGGPGSRPLPTRPGQTGLLADEFAKIKSMVTVNTPTLSQAVIAGMLLARHGRISELNTEQSAYYAQAMRSTLRQLDVCFPARGTFRPLCSRIGRAVGQVRHDRGHGVPDTSL
jgi:MbtH protein